MPKILVISLVSAVLALTIMCCWNAADIGKQVRLTNEMALWTGDATGRMLNLMARLDTLEAFLKADVLSSELMRASSYNSLPAQTWGDPFKTASGTTVSYQTLACSRDLITAYEQFMPGRRLAFGDTLVVVFLKKFIVEDSMADWVKGRVDIWNDSYAESMEWGVKPVGVCWP